MSLIECLSSISENRIKDFTLGKDKFTCTKCVMNVDHETLNLPALMAPDEDVSVMVPAGAEETNALDKAKVEIAKKVSEQAGAELGQAQYKIG